jgi:hypothetical protein
MGRKSQGACPGSVDVAPSRAPPGLEGVDRTCGHSPGDEDDYRIAEVVVEQIGAEPLGAVHRYLDEF